jgi:hypothetical protein
MQLVAQIVLHRAARAAGRTVSRCLECRQQRHDAAAVAAAARACGAARRYRLYRSIALRGSVAHAGCICGATVLRHPARCGGLAAAASRASPTGRGAAWPPAAAAVTDVSVRRRHGVARAPGAAADWLRAATVGQRRRGSSAAAAGPVAAAWQQLSAVAAGADLAPYDSVYARTSAVVAAYSCCCC